MKPLPTRRLIEYLDKKRYRVTKPKSERVKLLDCLDCGSLADEACSYEPGRSCKARWDLADLVDVLESVDDPVFQVGRPDDDTVLAGAPVTEANSVLVEHHTYRAPEISQLLFITTMKIPQFGKNERLLDLLRVGASRGLGSRKVG